MAERRSNEERSRATREKLVAAARRLFEARTYSEVAIDDVARAAGVTRGAIYHHFGGKQPLFKAVIEDIQDELADHVDRNAEKHDDPWDAFVAGWISFLEQAPTAGIGRVLMLEGPAVIGHRDWQVIDDSHFHETVTAAVEYFMSVGVLPNQRVEPVVRVLLSISNALGALIAGADDPEATRRAVAPVWAQLLNGLRTHPEAAAN
jgi:AcrR family transcriptional regulator